jgi:hypothetical protein
MSTATVMLLPFDAMGGRSHGTPSHVGDCRDRDREFVVRLGPGRPAHAVYVRRRLLVGLALVGMLSVLGVTAQSVLADRGGVPASTPTVRPATLEVAAASAPGSALQQPAPVAPVGTQYIVQPGDTLWSLGELFHGSQSVAGYVDALVAANGGASLQVGQLLTLP